VGAKLMFFLQLLELLSLSTGKAKKSNQFSSFSLLDGFIPFLSE